MVAAWDTLSLFHRDVSRVNPVFKVRKENWFLLKFSAQLVKICFQCVKAFKCFKNYLCMWFVDNIFLVGWTCRIVVNNQSPRFHAKPYVIASSCFPHPRFIQEFHLLWEVFCCLLCQIVRQV